MLYARWVLVQMGVEVTPHEQFIRTIWYADPRPKWQTHEEAIGSRSYQRVLNIVAAIERRAKETHETDHCSQEDR